MAFGILNRKLAFAFRVGKSFAEFSVGFAL